MTLLKVIGLEKRYKIYEHQFFRFLEVISGGILKFHKEKWVLRDINLEIEKGQSVGIVGRNGAGKSTLLKIIANTTKPTNGNVFCSGRVAAILELGMGFDNELTGQQNAIIGMHLLGVNGDEVEQKIQDIAAFAELGEYFFQPLRVYSSGMLVRLAFSVATAVEPDILIVDEALSVGDAYFQQKCAFTIEQYKAKGGTLLFVSHDANMIKSLCDRAILIDNGKLIMSGSPRDVIDFYHSNVLHVDGSDSKFITDYDEGAYRATSVTTNGDADLVSFKVEDREGEEVSVIESEQLLVVKYSVKLNKTFLRPAFGIIIRDRFGKSIFETSTFGQCMDEYEIAEHSIVNLEFRFNFNLYRGTYSFSVGVSNKGYARSEFEENSLIAHDVFQINVLEASHNLHYGGVFNMKPEIKVSSERASYG